MTWWDQLSAGQGAFFSGFFTAIGAIIAVLIAQKLFGNRITTLQDSVQETEKAIDVFKMSVEARLTEIEGLFNEVSSGLQRSLADTQAAIHETQDAEDEPVEPGAEVSTHDRVLESWHNIRDRFEMIASSPNIDGRTRAKYSRIDRRSYYDLLVALKADGYLPNIDLANAATSLWYSCRRKEEIAAEAAAKMEEYWAQISGWAVP